jgi:hypothetical protein
MSFLQKRKAPQRMAAERGFIELGTVWGARLGGYHDFRFRGEDRTVSRRNSQHFTVFDGLASIRGRLRAKTFTLLSLHTGFLRFYPRFVRENSHNSFRINEK